MRPIYTDNSENHLDKHYALSTKHNDGNFSAFHVSGFQHKDSKVCGFLVKFKFFN